MVTVRRCILAATAALALLTPVVARADGTYYEQREAAKRIATAKELAEWEATQQGYANRVLDLDLCQGTLVVTDPELQARMTAKYRNDPRYEQAYSRGYLAPDGGLMAPGLPTLEVKRQTRCLLAVSAAPWLALAPGGAERLERNVEEEKLRSLKGGK
jgi:hypothetical protein